MEQINLETVRGWIILAAQDCHMNDGQIQYLLTNFNNREIRTTPEVAREVCQRWYNMEP